MSFNGGIVGLAVIAIFILLVIVAASDNITF